MWKLCCAGHLQCQSTGSKQDQSDNRPTVSPDVSMLRPELQQQWHVDRNLHLGLLKVKPHSHRKAIWQCNNCPAGQPHIWAAKVADRTRGTQCPYCSNRLVCKHSSLATVAPEVALYWNYSKNEKTPEQVLAGSNLRAEWQCPACKWEWQAPIQMRTRKSAGCPKCSRAQRVTQRQPTFAEAQPAELSEWDYELNDAEGLFPSKVTLGSNKLVHWKCACCPRGQTHRWTTAPHCRIGHGSGCAVCAGQQPCICNSLESLFPSVAAELDVEKNDFAPSEITARSNKKVWWRNTKRGSWMQAVDQRTDSRLRRQA